MSARKCGKDRTAFQWRILLPLDSLHVAREIEDNMYRFLSNLKPKKGF